jgi:hypothetical protein
MPTKPAATPDTATSLYLTTFYDGIVVLKKAMRPPSYHVQVGTKSF